MTENYAVKKETKHNLQTKNELLLAIDSFFLSHPECISDRDWLKLIGQLLEIINTRRI